MDLPEEDRKVIRQAAQLMCRGRSETATALLYHAMTELANSYPQTGAGSFQRWLSSLQSLGEICLSLYKREKSASGR